MQIACVLYPNFTSLDLIGPYQVYGAWPDAELHIVAETLDPVSDDRGLMTYIPTATFESMVAPDVVVVPGSGKPFGPLKDEALLNWVRQVEPGATWMTSVCTGSSIYAAAGLLQGKLAATHWSFREVLAGLGAEVSTDRYVFDGKFVTGGGVTAGIDMALALTAEEHGEFVAKSIQLVMEYDPKPPFAGGSKETADSDVLESVTARLLAGASDGNEGS